MLPLYVTEKIQRLFEGQEMSNIAESYSHLSDNYKKARSPVLQYKDALAYACARMPATFATIEYVLREFYMKCADYAIDNVLDIGSGTGALMCYFLQTNILYRAVEKSESMVRVSKQVIEDGKLKPEVFREDISCYLNRGLISCCSFFVYSFNEIANKTEVLRKVIDLTEDYIFIIETGTPKGFEVIQLAKQLAEQNNCGIIAPCASSKCPLEKNDWCHFGVRLPRTRMHNLVKHSKLPYEDEKFCYVIISKKTAGCVSNNRIIKRPIKKKGHVILDVCSSDGCKRVISNNKSDRKKEWGDEI